MNESGLLDLRGGLSTAPLLQPVLVGEGAVTESSERTTSALERPYIHTTAPRAFSAHHVRVEQPRLLKPGNSPADVFLPLQAWRGVVLAVTNDAFVARLEDLRGDRSDDEAEILLAEVARDDLELIKPGAVFYWAVGYLVKIHGQRIRASLVRFRRLPTMTSQDWEEARALAAPLGAAFAS